MTELTGEIRDLNIDYKTGEYLLTLSINEKNAIKRMFDELRECGKLSVKLSKWREKRSLNANNYMWLLCGKLAEKLDMSAEEIYRNAIHEVGVFRPTELPADEAETILYGWSLIGKGWFGEKLDIEPKNGMVSAILYYGSSRYNTKQMSRLIDNIVASCKEQGIETKTPDEITRLISLWEPEK